MSGVVHAAHARQLIHAIRAPSEVDPPRAPDRDLVARPEAAPLDGGSSRWMRWLDVLLLLQCGGRDAPAPAACSTSMTCRVSRACIARVAHLEATVQSMCVEERPKSTVVSKGVRAVGGDQLRVRRVTSRRGLSGKRSLGRGC